MIRFTPVFVCSYGALNAFISGDGTYADDTRVKGDGSMSLPPIKTTPNGGNDTYGEPEMSLLVLFSSLVALSSEGMTRLSFQIMVV
jgi:hypothetical protein